METPCQNIRERLPSEALCLAQRALVSGRAGFQPSQYDGIDDGDSFLFLFLFFGRTTWLAGSQSRDQGLNLGHGSESAKS